MTFCTLTGPESAILQTPRRGAEVGKPLLLNGGSYVPWKANQVGR
jgi:hypothetical protein